MNIYRGCEHGCKYCYAIYSHDYLGDGNFFWTVYYKNKESLLKALESELSSLSWKWEIINIWWVTDSYQPIEEKLWIMRDVLKLMIKYKNPIIISTKSDLILRDLDLINELSNLALVNIAFTITTLDENIRKLIEPNASPTINRFDVLKKLKTTNCITGLHLMPIIPYITDGRDNMESILKKSEEIWVDYVLPGAMYLRWKTKTYFLNSIKSYNLDLYEKLNLLYKAWSAWEEYKTKFYTMFNELKKKYNTNTSYSKIFREKQNSLKK